MVNIVGTVAFFHRSLQRVSFGWIGWINPVDFLGHPVDFCSLSVKRYVCMRPYPVDLISNPVEYFENIHAGSLYTHLRVV